MVPWVIVITVIRFRSTPAANRRRELMQRAEESDFQVVIDFESLATIDSSGRSNNSQRSSAHRPVCRIGTVDVPCSLAQNACRVVHVASEATKLARCPETFLEPFATVEGEL